MISLRWRLLINIAAAVLIGLAAVDVAFVFWTQGQLNQKRLLLLKTGALALQAQVSEQSSSKLALLNKELEIELDIVDEASAKVGAKFPFLEPKLLESGRFVLSGYEYVALPMPQSAHKSYAVARLPLKDTSQTILNTQKTAILFLLAVLGLILFLAMLLLRTAVFNPIARLTQLVGQADRQGLLGFGASARGELGRLSKAIINLNQQLEEDRTRISLQLKDLNTANADLLATQTQLIRAERLAVVGQLAAGLAHEIGNPLAILSGFVEVLKDRALPETDRLEALTRMASELQRLNNIMRGLLDFSRAPKVGTEKGELNEALKQVEFLLKPQDRLRNIALTILPLEQPVTLPLSCDAFIQVLINLVLNAVDAISGPGQVEIRAWCQDAYLMVTVDDSGPGIPLELYSKIFEPFFTTKKAGAGTGLGLAVCERIVNAASGEIRVGESLLGGARFTIKLPAVENLAQ